MGSKSGSPAGGNAFTDTRSNLVDKGAQGLRIGWSSEHKGPKTEYHLTEKGRELGDVIAALEQFGNKHLSNPVVSAECGECLSVDEEAAVVENVT